MEEIISSHKNARSFNIIEFISFLNEKKQKGATHLRFTVVRDPMWPFEWVETFRTKSESELKQEKINQLQAEIEELKK